MLEIKPVAAFADNYIWLLVRAGSRLAAVVDPGDAIPVRAALGDAGLELSAVLVTHHHGDHVGGILDLCAGRQVPVFGPAGEDIPGRTHAVADGDTIDVPGLDARFDVMGVPGHTLGHVAYVGSGVVFCGDTLFMGGCGRLFEGTPAQMHTSLSRLAALPGDTRAYCAHEYTAANLKFALAVEPGNEELQQRARACTGQRSAGLPTVPGTLNEERATNPFLRTHVPEVIAAASRHAGRPLPDPVSVFATLRQWKNNF